MDAPDLLSAALRGLVAAFAAAVLLLVAYRWGRNLAGLLAGLPTITGPALVWLALDHGATFAATACTGAVAAGAACALFALGYGLVGQRHGWPFGLAAGVLASLLPLLLLHPVTWPPLPMLAAVLACCTLCLLALPLAPPHSGKTREVAQPARHRGALTTVLVAASVSALTSLFAQQVGPMWAGMLSSPPLLAAVLAVALHRQGCTCGVQQLLHGYIGGLFGRSVFVAVFGVLLQPIGLVPALAVSTTLGMVVGWGVTWGASTGLPVARSATRRP